MLLLPTRAELEFSLTISYVPHKQSSLGQALDRTNLEKQTIWEVQDGTGPNCTNRNFKFLTFSHTDESVNVILQLQASECQCCCFAEENKALKG